MIIKCEKCQTRFRLDDSRVTEKGVKVRCTKCRHIFVVQKQVTIDSESVVPDAAVPVPPLPDSQFTLESSPDQRTVEAPFTTTPPPLPADSSDVGSFGSEAPASTALSFEVDEENAFGVMQDDNSPDTLPSRAAVDFSDIEFGDDNVVPSSPLQDSEPYGAPPSHHESTKGLDFSDDDMFGAVIEPAASEPPEQTIAFDFDDNAFADSMEIGASDSRSTSGARISLDAHADTPFNFGEIDFGEELTSVAVQQVNPDDLKSSQQILFAPLATPPKKEDEADVPATQKYQESAAEDELPPLSISSRRRQSPLLSALFAIIAIVVLSSLGYYGYTSVVTSPAPAVTETGRIQLRAIKSVFVTNSVAGELLVISGEAVNEFSKPQASLQVKATVFSATGQSLAAKTAYCGNPLTEEQLKSLSLENIEAAMANQFGDSLANMAVAPGKAIPFVVVLANLPTGARDFGVQAAGSTATSGK